MNFGLQATRVAFVLSSAAPARTGSVVTVNGGMIHVR
jgi:hypothetical protein